MGAASSNRSAGASRSGYKPPCRTPNTVIHDVLMPALNLADSTSKSLLEGLRIGDPIAWARVATVYGPLIIQWCKRWGLPHHDREDICQAVLTSVVLYGETFNKAKPSDQFRKWLFTVTRNHVIKQQTSHHRITTIDAQSISKLVADEQAMLDDPEDPPEVLNELHRRAIQVVRDSCLPENWDIFMAAVTRELDYEEIARRFNTTVGNVRVIRCRYTKKLQDLLELTDDKD